MRIVACLRVSALPRPHVHSSVVECRVCHEACWRDLADAAIATETARAVDHEPVAVCGSRWPKKGPPS